MRPTARLRSFAWAMVLSGGLILVLSVHQLFAAGVHWQLGVLTALAALSGVAALRLPGRPATFSLGEAFSFAALFLYGPAAGALTAAVDSLGCNLRLKRLSPVKFLFNVATPALAMWVAGMLVFHVVALPLPGAVPRLGVALLSVSAAAIVFFALGTGLVATAIALETATTPARVWSDLSGLWLETLVGAYVGFLVAFFHDALGFAFLVLVIPIPLILYAALSSWTGRVEDRLRYLDDLNQSYQAMVESFATAIDEKDQVTHGHIRRVQAYCLALARQIGIRDDAQLKALETAALLHDVGKLGIPERILNKPGRLTPAEFEYMKQHVTIGTRILGTITFPYPILPIVRHHHENWDGSGYPDGLSGEGIPLGARILMIVDCFDALTSDRPYRRRLGVDDALDILKSCRGTMYDPSLVDTFVQLLPTLSVSEVDEGAAPSTPLLDGSVSESDGGLTLAQLESAADLAPGWLWTWWQYSAIANAIVLKHAAGPGAQTVLGCTLPVGAGVSGWVVGEGQEMRGCDGRLDLGGLADRLGNTRASLPCLSLPVPVEETIGALTCYHIQTTVELADEFVYEVATTVRTRLAR